jgi:hypothetical protein
LSGSTEPHAEPFDLPGFWQHLAAIGHPGPAPDVTAAAVESGLEPSPLARRALRRRIWLRPVPFLVALIPATLAFWTELPVFNRYAFFGVTLVVFALVRLALRPTGDVTTFRVREHEARALWQSTVADWEAKAGPRRFDDKRAELDKLKDWWTQAAGQPQQRPRIEAALRRGFGELQQIADQIQLARTSLRPHAEQTYRRLLQAQLDLEAIGKKER